MVRAAINDWGNLYMSETVGAHPVTGEYGAATMFELGGFIGAGSGLGFDKLFNGNRGPMNGFSPPEFCFQSARCG